MQINRKTSLEYIFLAPCISSIGVSRTMLEKSGGQVKGLTQKKKRVGDNYADCWFGFSVSEPSFTRKNEMFEVSK